MMSVSAVRVARRDTYGFEHLEEVTIRRLVKAGDVVPPGLEVEATELLDIDLSEVEQLRRLSIADRLAVLEAKASAAATPAATASAAAAATGGDAA